MDEKQKVKTLRNVTRELRNSLIVEGKAETVTVKKFFFGLADSESPKTLLTFVIFILSFNVHEQCLCQSFFKDKCYIKTDS